MTVHELAGPDAAEVEELLAAVRGDFGRIWPDATYAETSDLESSWVLAARQGLTQFGAPELLPLAVRVQAELGRIGNPLPVVDIALAALAASRKGDDALVAGIEDGSVRPVIARGTVLETGASARHVESAGQATDALIIDVDAGLIAWYDLSGASRTAQPGLAVPTWHELRITTAARWSIPLAEDPEFVLLRRLGLAARAMGAIGRQTELAVEWAIQRVQFGRTIGSYQAVSHRLVNAHITVTAAAELLDAALIAFSTVADWSLAAEIYLEYVGDHASGLAFDAHHTLAATGYFEEHEAPWLFRRAHADLSLAGQLPTTGSVGAQLLAGAALPDSPLTPSAQSIRDEVLEAFAPWADAGPSNLSSWDDDARAVLRENGWIGVGWPKDVGGGGWPVLDVIAFSEALAYVNPPLGNVPLGINSIAPVLIEHGRPEVRDLLLARILDGDLSVALGYSEPEAGSDLASLRTRGTKVDGGWQINGQKLWGTCLPDSEFVLLAARTDPDAVPKQAGISLFLVDADSPGLTTSVHTSLAGNQSATSFWDDVFVPDDRLVGRAGEGWSALGAALASERVLIGSNAMRSLRLLERLVQILRSGHDVVAESRRERVAEDLGRVAVRLHAARALVNRAIRGVVTGTGTAAGAAMAKVAATELGEDLNATAVALLGPDALLKWGVEGAVGAGYFEDGLRASIMGVIAGGTGDIQRNIIARGIGLLNK